MSVDIVPEHAAVNRSVTGSSPVWGARKRKTSRKTCLLFFNEICFAPYGKYEAIWLNQVNKITLNINLGFITCSILKNMI